MLTVVGKGNKLIYIANQYGYSLVDCEQTMLPDGP